jgi:hypothetical protein
LHHGVMPMWKPTGTGQRRHQQRTTDDEGLGNDDR